MSIRSILSRPWVRAGVGIAVSAAFGAVIVSRVDADAVADAWAQVAVAGLVVAVAISVAEVSTRAVRWRLLLRRLAPVGFGTSLGYLGFGHLANAILPARLGDVARGLVAASGLRVSSMAVLGSIAVERVSDAALLGMAVIAAVLVGFRELGPTAVVIVIGAGLTAVLAGAAAAVAGLLGHRIELFAHLVRRFLNGAAALRDPRDRAVIGLLTVVSFALTIGICTTVAHAAGVALAPWQAAIVVAGATLATAIPAGPASLGTYEFAGMTLLGTMGVPPESALLVIGLTHAIVVVPPALIGLVAMWTLGIRVSGATQSHVEAGRIGERPA